MTKVVKPNGKIIYNVKAGTEAYRIECEAKHGGPEHFDGDHYHVYRTTGGGRGYRMFNMDPNTPTSPAPQNQYPKTFAPGDNLPSVNQTK